MIDVILVVLGEDEWREGRRASLLGLGGASGVARTAGRASGIIYTIIIGRRSWDSVGRWVIVGSSLG